MSNGSAVGWLVGWLVDRLFGCSVDRLVGWLTGWLTCRKTAGRLLGDGRRREGILGGMREISGGYSGGTPKTF